MEKFRKISKEGSKDVLFNKMDIVKAFYSKQEGKISVQDRVVKAVAKVRGQLAKEEEQKQEKLIELQRKINEKQKHLGQIKQQNTQQIQELGPEIIEVVVNS